MDFNVAMLVDIREAKIIEILQKQQQDIQTSALDIGDVHITINQEALPTKTLIIERKTLADLAASIKDGRYKEQKMRLQQACQDANGNMKLLYIIENRVPYHDTGDMCHISAKALASFMFNTLFRDQIPVITTQSTLETVDVLRGLLRRLTSPKELEKLGWFASSDAPSDVKQSAYTEAHIKTRKKDNIDPMLSFQMQLSAIPGISASKAASITQELHVSNMKDLIHILDSQGERALLQVKGVGKALAKSIYTYLCEKTENT